MIETVIGNRDIEDAGFDYCIRTAELVKYLRETGKNFPLTERLLICGIETGLACKKLNDEEIGEIKKAASCAISQLNEADFITEIAVAGGYLTQQQSTHIRNDGKEITRMLRIIRDMEEIEK